MKKYNFFTFCENLDKIGKDAEEKEKKQKLGEIVSALQRPMQDVLQSVILEQEKQVNKLLKYIHGKRDIKDLR